MRILALDSAAACASVAVCADGKVVYENNLNLGLTHSETLQAACDRALASLKLTYNDIDVFAVTRGPGSFTGLRIGLTAAKAFAYAAGKKVLGVSTLEALAEPFRCGPGVAVLSLLDARHRRVYAGLYRDGRALLPEKLGDIDDYFLQIAALAGQGGPRELILAGDCAARYLADPLVAEFCRTSDLKLLGCGGEQISAAAVARLCAVRVTSEPASLQEAAELLPVYLGATQAERAAGIYV